MNTQHMNRSSRDIQTAGEQVLERCRAPFSLSCICGSSGKRHLCGCLKGLGQMINLKIPSTSHPVTEVGSDLLAPERLFLVGEVDCGMSFPQLEASFHALEILEGRRKIAVVNLGKSHTEIHVF